MAEANYNDDDDDDVVDLTRDSEDDGDEDDDNACRMEHIKQNAPAAPRSEADDDDNDKTTGSAGSTEDEEYGTFGNGIGQVDNERGANNRKQSTSPEEYDRRLAAQKAIQEEQHKLLLKVQLAEQKEQHARKVVAIEAEHRHQRAAKEAKHKRQLEAYRHNEKTLQQRITDLESQLRQSPSASVTPSATSAANDGGLRFDSKPASVAVPDSGRKRPMDLLLSDLLEEDSTEINSERDDVDKDDGNNQNVNTDHSDNTCTDDNDRKLPANQDATNNSSHTSSDPGRHQQNCPQSRHAPAVATALDNVAVAEEGGMDSDTSSVDSYREFAIVSKEAIGDAHMGESRQYKLEDVLGKGAYNKPFDKVDLEFCCAECRCIGLDEEWKKLRSDYCFWSSGETLHRRCCHGHLQKDLEFDPGLTPGELAFTSVNYAPPPKKAIERSSNPYNRQGYGFDVDEHYRILQQRKERQNDTNDEDKSKDYLFVAKTCSKHISNLDSFRQLVDDPSFRPREDGIVVVDFFAGIGTGRVALEKNGIRVKKYIAVEIDPVALFVLKHNHDAEFRSSIGAATHSSCNATTMVYYDKFEEVENELDIFLNEHAVDLVLGGPPCQDFSKVNGGRKGVKGEQGSYHYRLGRMIRKIERIAKEQGRHLYFLIENVSTDGNDSKQLEDAYDIPPIHIDAQIYSPTCRVRAFYTNLPLAEDPEERNALNKFSSAKSCLDDNYVMKGDTTNGPDHQGGKEHTFMASRGRINHPRMRVVKEVSPGKLDYRYASVVERSRMMGYHDSYVAKPLGHLFRALLKPLRGGRMADREKGGFVWHEDLPKGYHCFSGVQHKFDNKSNELKIATQPTGLRYYEEDEEMNKNKKIKENKKRKHRPGQIKYEAPECFDETDYGYHLIGNAYSVPVVEMLLRPLKHVFEAGGEYTGHQYEYYWLRNT